MKKQTIFIYEISTCNRRKLDGSKLYEYFSKNNYKIVHSPKEANIIILITCAYSNKHAESSLLLTKKFLDYNAELIVTGCLPDIETDNLRKIFNGKTISTKELDNIDEFFPQNKVKFSDIKDSNILWENINEYKSITAFKKIFEKSQMVSRMKNKFSYYLEKNLLHNDSSNCRQFIISYLSAKYIKEKLNPNFKLHKDAYFIRPSWGCLGNCSYCVIKNAIGPLKSKPLNIIIDEFKNGLNQKYKNFIFDADDIGAYGIDIGSNLPELINKITNIPGNYKIHIRNIHPEWIVKYADNLEIVLKKRKIQFISCSIQSGSKRILKLMQRFSDIEKIKESFNKMFEAYPDLILTTECINGFPTETIEEFKETLNFIKEVDFSIGYIFPFSSRPGTIAEQLEPKVSYNEILVRMKYAKDYLKKVGYDNSYLKSYKILLFSKSSTTFKLDKEIKSFCLSTID